MAANEHNQRTGADGKYDPQDVIVALRLREMLGVDEKNPFFETLSKYRPEQLLSLLESGEKMQSRCSGDVLKLVNEHSVSSLLLFANFVELLRNDPKHAGRALRIFAMYPAQEIARFAQSKELAREKRKLYVAENRERIRLQNQLNKKAYRAKRAAELTAQIDALSKARSSLACP